MSLFPDSSAAWAALIIVVLPLLIIGAGELEERLRQRDSPYQPAVSTIRVWVVPLLTVWVLARALLDVATDTILLGFVGTRRPHLECDAPRSPPCESWSPTWPTDLGGRAAARFLGCCSRFPDSC